MIEVDKVVSLSELEAAASAPKATALSCKLSTRESLPKIQLHDISLRLEQTSGLDVERKIRWAATKKEKAVAKLRGELVGGVCGDRQYVAWFVSNARLLHTGIVTDTKKFVANWKVLKI